MPNTYDGACAAIRARLSANWTTTQIAFENEEPPANPWPPIDPNSGNSAPWAFLEIDGNAGILRAMGSPGDQLWQYTGLIWIYVYVPMNAGADLARQYAVSIGEIFRNKHFYDDGNGSYVWSQWPGPAKNIGNDAGQGNAWGVILEVDFIYFHRG